MKPPSILVEVIDSPTSTSWFDDEGIFCSVSKKGQEPSIREQKKQLENLKKSLDGKKICILLDTTNASQSSKATKDLFFEELPKIAKAIAFICKSPLSRMLANMFFGLKPTTFPIKIFSTEEDARKWLRQYL